MNLTTKQRTKKAEQLRIAAQIVETGCEWEYLSNGEWDSPWVGLNVQRAVYEGYPIRIKPSGQIKPTPAWKLPAPPEGRKWHREDWTQEMLPDGWRPLLEDESVEDGDQIDHEANSHDEISWTTHHGPRWASNAKQETSYFLRTRRPLPAPTKPEIPVPEGYRELHDDEKDGRWIEGAKFSDKDGFDQLGGGAYAVPDQRIIVPLPVPRVPLEPGDVPPGTCIKPSSEYVGWGMVCEVDATGIHLFASRHLSWGELMNCHWMIKRPTDTEWQPASKPAP